MTESLPKVAQLGQIAANGQPGLDAQKLMGLARDKLTFARTRLNEIKRDYRLKEVEIETVYQQRLDEALRERDDARRTLEAQTLALAKPAQDMIDLVRKMLE